MFLEIVTPPASEPVTLAELKAHLRVDHEDEDDLITSLGKVARVRAEQYMQRQILTATWRYYLDRFPRGGVGVRAGVIRPRRPKLIAVSALKYVDTAGTTQTLAASEYQVDAISEPGRIIPAYGKFWPTTRDQLNAVWVEYTCGYGTSLTAEQEPIKDAIKVLASDFYEQRASTVVGAISSSLTLRTIESLLAPFRVFWWQPPAEGRGALDTSGDWI